MRHTNIKNNKKFLGIIILCILALVAGVLALNFAGTSIYAHAAEIECCDNSEHEHSTQTTFSDLNGNLVLEQKYLSAHYADGTMGMILDETYDPDEIVFEPFEYTHLQKSTVMSSGKPDNQSIVAVFLGDGFDSSDADQDLFLNRVDEIAKYMITVEPFNYYKDYLTIYAVHSISTDSGISGEVSGEFACRNEAGNPATPQCTPVDSSVFNCTHGRRTEYSSYYQWRSSAGRVLLEMSTANRARARNHARAASESVNMIQILANSQMSGGTGEMIDLGVAITSIRRDTAGTAWMSTVMHEFGHTFGGLWDEYWNGLTFDNKWPNITNNTNAATVKWSQWMGYKDVDHFPLASTEKDGNPNQATKPWFRPHQSCRMRYSNSPFCAVCVHELLGRMATATGFTLFNTTNTGTNNIRIDKLNISVSGSFEIPERINGRIVTEIGSSAFANAGMSQIIIPASVTSIGDSAFEYCSKLRSITIPSSVTNMGSYVFYGIRNSYPSSLMIFCGASGKPDGWNKSWMSNNTVFWDINDTNFVENDGSQYVLQGSNAILTRYIGNGDEIIVPQTVKINNINRSVTSIGDYAFFGCKSVTTVSLPTNVTVIGNYGFWDCDNLINLTISDTLTSLGNYAFRNCGKLAKIQMITSGVIFNPIYKSEGDCFIRISDEALVFGSKNSVIPSYVKSIEDYAFYMREITDITIPYGVTEIGDYAFYNCSNLENISFEQGSQLTKIGEFAFSNCTSLTNMLIPNATTIGDYAFYRCQNLTSITISKKTILIGKNAFYACYNLENVFFETNSELESIGNSAFFKCNISAITIPKNVITIGDSAFANCYDLSNVTFEANSKLESIGNSAFTNCSIYTITIPKNVITIGNYAFEDCFYLSSVTFEANSGLESIGNSAFTNCNLSAIILPRSLIAIGDSAFANCGNLAGVFFEEDCYLETIEMSAFYGCNSLESINIPDNIRTIDNYAFADCDNLSRIIIPDSIIYIGNGVFQNWTVYQCVYFEGIVSDAWDWNKDWKKDSQARVIWLGNTNIITLDQNGGINGTDVIEVALGDVMPAATAPYKQGYAFIGYYDENGVQYYNSHMLSAKTWNKELDTILYAKYISANSEAWDGIIPQSGLPLSQVFLFGDGLTGDTAYQISTGGQLAYLAQKINSGNSFVNTYFTLTQDIFLNDITSSGWANLIAYIGSYGTSGVLDYTYEPNYWIPIGKEVSPFKGTFNGNGFTVYGVYVNSTSDYQGLFGYVLNGEIRNLSVEQSYIKGSNYVGGIAGYCDGDIYDCFNSGIVIGDFYYLGGINSDDYVGGYYVGGIAGRCSGNIYNCYNSGDIIGTDYVGGISGAYSDITNGVNAGDVFGIRCVGGVVGSGGNVLYCRNIGNITSVLISGGVAGYGNFISDCFNSGSVFGEDRTGGIAGCVTRIYYSVNEGNVFGDKHTGGIMGGLNIGGYLFIYNCYNKGYITGNKYVGGIIGSIFGSGDKIIIVNSFNLGRIIGDDYVGGITGYFSTYNNNYYSETAVIVNCYNQGEIRGASEISCIGGIAGYVGRNTEMFNIYNSYEFDPNLINFAGGIIGILETYENNGEFIYYIITDESNYVREIAHMNGAINANCINLDENSCEEIVRLFNWFINNHLQYWYMEYNYGYGFTFNLWILDAETFLPIFVQP